MSELTLVIGSKRYSSWSLRPWLALRLAGVRFEEVVIELRQPDTKQRIAQYSPSGKVPLLIDGPLKVWESLAICEYLAERFPGAGLWPADSAARATARAISAEVHSGFAALRNTMSMDCQLREPRRADPETAADIARVTQIWRECRARFGQGGAFLFGQPGIADAMYAPAVTRFHSYQVPLDPVSAAYRDAVLALPAMRDWYAAAAEE